jgi:hypothetical protein
MANRKIYVASDVQTAPASANFLVAAAILGLFAVSAVLSAPAPGFDELAHVSYIAHIQSTGNLWPALESMRLLDAHTFQFTEQANYLNHPPIYYALLAALGPKLEGHPQAILAYRLFDVWLTTMGLAALLGLGLVARFARHEFYAFAIPLVCIPILAPLAGTVNNDNLAFLGGAVATLGAWQLAATDRDKWLTVALAGMVVAAWAKLTGLVLTAVMLGAVIAYLTWHKRLRGTRAVLLVLASLLATAPYFVYFLLYGSPTPETPAQIALVEAARATGWSDLPRESFPAYLLYFVCAFIANWMPIEDRSIFPFLLLVIPAAALVAALMGIVLSLRRLRLGRETTLDVVVVAGATALAVTLALHIGYSFSYNRHFSTGWTANAYPRYYLPIAAIVPLAGLSLLAAIDDPRRRVTLRVFLVGGPMLFLGLGASTGWLAAG